MNTEITIKILKYVFFYSSVLFARTVRKNNIGLNVCKGRSHGCQKQVLTRDLHGNCVQ